MSPRFTSIRTMRQGSLGFAQVCCGLLRIAEVPLRCVSVRFAEMRYGSRRFGEVRQRTQKSLGFAVIDDVRGGSHNFAQIS